MLFDDLVALGVTSRRLQVEVARGRLLRPRRGIYVDAQHWRSMNADARYRFRVRATGLTRTSPLVVSHQSAAALHGFPIIGSWPSTVHALKTGASGGSPRPGVTLHTGGPPADVVEIDGLTATTVERTLVDVASGSRLVVAVTMLDHALRLGLTTRAALFAMLDQVNPRYGAARARFAIQFATPLSNRPGESLSRVRMHELGFEAPELQVAFVVSGGKRAIVDFYWRGCRLIGEFDGRGKYQRDEFTHGRDPGEIVWQEKLREDELRKIVDGFTRWTWEIALSADRFTRHLIDAGVPRRLRAPRR